MDRQVGFNIEQQNIEQLSVKVNGHLTFERYKNSKLDDC